ncbi:hypothetical protein [Enemella sp. A6]|uniref:hypothetical protein n=1 Tax=Enemella sp. A6 TaxID=3440152 RepID=UPI003EB96700
METRNRRWLLWGLLVFGAMLLSGCGAKIDSVLQLNADGSGERTFTMTLSGEDQKQYIKGDVAKIDALFKSSTPEQLEYLGVADGSGGAKVYSFKMTFSDIDDYTDKVTRLMAAGGNRKPVEIEWKVEDSVFRKSVTYKDNTNTKALMKWANQAVYDSDVMDTENPNFTADDLTEEGQTVLRHGEESYEITGSGSVRKVDDRGAMSVQVNTEGVDTGRYKRTITYELPREHYVVDEAGFDEFFDSVTPEGGTLTPAGGTGTTWVLEFSSEDPADIVSWTNAALISEQTEFTVESKVAQQEDGLARELRVVDNFECSAVCHRDGRISGDLELPEPWQRSSGQSPSTEPIVYHKPVQAETRSVRVKAAERNPSLTLSVGFAADDVAGLEDAVAKAISGSDGSDVEITDEDGRKIFTVVQEGDSQADFQTAYETSQPGLFLKTDEVNSTLFQRHTVTNVGYRIEHSGPAGGPVELTVELVGLGTIDEEASNLPEGATIDGNTVTLTVDPSADMYLVAKQTQWLGVAVVGGVIAAALIGAVGLVIVVRRMANDDTAPSAPGAGPR